MCRMLLSIKPEFVEKILSKEKQYEYRKFRCRKDVDGIIIYSTAPSKQVVAEAEVDAVIEGDVAEVWERTEKYSGIQKEFYEMYYEGKETAYAYHLTNLKIYEEPRALTDYGVERAPQSVQYVW